MHIGEYLSPIDRPKAKLNERQTILQELWSVHQRGDPLFLKKKNWNRYVAWLKKEKLDEKEIGRTTCIARFKKAKLPANERHLLPLKSAREMAILYSHIPTKDLYFSLSMAKDYLNRGEDVRSYIKTAVFMPNKA